MPISTNLCQPLKQLNHLHLDITRALLNITRALLDITRALPNITRAFPNITRALLRMECTYCEGRINPFRLYVGDTTDPDKMTLSEACQGKVFNIPTGQSTYDVKCNKKGLLYLYTCSSHLRNYLSCSVT